MTFKLTRLVAVVATLAGFATVSFAADQATVVSKDSLVNITIEELAKFDGKEGRKAYVAVDSVIYNVTDVKAWKNGEHKGNKAGTDVSGKITKAPHGKKPITKLPKVGKLVAAAPAITPEPAAVPADTTKK